MTARKFLIIFLSIAAALFLLLLGSKIYLEHWLNRQLPVILNRDPDRTYDIRYKEVNINWLNQRLSIRDIVVVPRAPADSINGAALSATVRRFDIEQIDWKQLFLHKEIQTQTLRILRPTILVELAPTQELSRNSRQVTLFWRDIFTRIRVRNFYLDSAYLQLKDLPDSTERGTFGPFALRVKNVVVDTQTINDPFPFRYGSVSLEGRSLWLKTDSFYHVYSASVHVQDHAIVLDSVGLAPVYSKTAFQRHTPYQNDWFRLFIRQVKLDDILWGFRGKRLFVHVGSVRVLRPDLYDYRDKRVPRPAFYKKPLPASLFRSLPVTITLDTVQAENGSVVYEEVPPDGLSSGKVSFTRFNVAATHITNDSARLQKYPHIDISLRNLFMGKALLTAQIRFDMLDKKDRFHVKGSLHGMPLSLVNDALYPLTGVSIKGTARRLDFSMTCADVSASGHMRFQYSDLTLDVFKKKEHTRRGFLSGLANLLARGDNIAGDRKFREVSYSFYRWQDRSFFNYFWQGIKVGAMETIFPIANYEQTQQEQSGAHQE